MVNSNRLPMGLAGKTKPLEKQFCRVYYSESCNRNNCGICGVKMVQIYPAIVTDKKPLVNHVKVNFCTYGITDSSHINPRSTVR